MIMFFVIVESVIIQVKIFWLKCLNLMVVLRGLIQSFLTSIKVVLFTLSNYIRKNYFNCINYFI